MRRCEVREGFGVWGLGFRVSVGEHLLCGAVRVEKGLGCGV